jgi:hypothetical protein
MLLRSRNDELALASEQSVHGLWGNGLREEDAAVDDDVRIEIESLRKLKTGELRTRYRDVFGEASASFNRAYLFRRIAWRLQAEAEGDLGERARRRASDLGNDSDLRLRAPQSFWSDVERKRDSPDRDPRLPPVGTELKRVYNGQILRVTVLPNSFEFHGKQYASLSAIAHRVTGTRWNGFHFFGLKQEWKHE